MTEDEDAPRAEDAETAAPSGRRRYRHTALAVLVAVLAFAGGRAAWELLPLAQPDARDAPDGEPIAALLPDVDLPVLTVVTIDPAVAEDDATAVGSVVVLGIERATARGSIVPVPPATELPVPGHGATTLAAAYALEGPALLGDALAGLLEVRSDAVIALPADAWTAAVAALGGDAEVAAAIAGDPAELVDDLAAVASGYREVVELVVTSGTASGGGGLASAFEAGGASSDDAGLLAAMLGELAEAAATDGLEAEVLPLARVAEDAGTVTPDRTGVTALVIDRFAAAPTPVDIAAGTTLQILDGTGSDGADDEGTEDGTDDARGDEPTDDQDPDAGDTVDDAVTRVAALLEPAGYEVILTGVAARSAEPRTRIVVQNDEPATLAAARDVRDRLGVGTLERAGNPVSVVDLTIVVGDDLP